MLPVFKQGRRKRWRGKWKGENKGKERGNLRRHARIFWFSFLQSRGREGRKIVSWLCLGGQEMTERDTPGDWGGKGVISFIYLSLRACMYTQMYSFIHSATNNTTSNSQFPLGGKRAKNQIKFKFHLSFHFFHMYAFSSRARKSCGEICLSRLFTRIPCRRSVFDSAAGVWFAGQGACLFGG